MHDSTRHQAIQQPADSSFSNRATLIAVFLLLMIHAGLLAYSATLHSPTMDEPGHLVAGLTHWEYGRFEVYRVNPPLVHFVAAVPVLMAGYEEDWSGFYDGPGARPEFRMGRDFIEANGPRSIWLFTIARWACIPFSLAGGLFCFFWGRELWGTNLAGLIALTLWCFEPNILAHGELITPDCAATSLGLGAGHFFWRWLRAPSWERVIAAGILLGLAELTKSTWIILFVLWPLLWLLWVMTAPRRMTGEASNASPAADWKSFPQLVAVLLLALYVLNLGYGFDGTFTKLKDYTFVSSTFTGLDQSREPGNRFADTWLADMPVPLPKQYLSGIALQKKDFEHYSTPSYLRGEWKDGGWWYYYLYGLLVKVPHGTQALFVLAVFTLIWQKWTAPSRVPSLSRNVRFRDLAVLIVPALAVLVLVSSQMEFNHHLRYVLPVFGFTFVFIGVAASWFQRSKTH